MADLTDEQAALEETRNAATAKAEQVDQARQATEEKKAEYQEARAEAEAELGRLIQEEEERRARESYERMQREAEAAAARQAEASRQAQAQAPQAPAPSQSGGGGGGAAAARAAAPAPVSIPAASSRAGTAVNAALSQLGTPYRFAASEPGVAFDCSGLTSWAWGQAGVSLPHQSRAQAGVVPSIPIEAAQPGDLVFFYSPISHVGIYLGGGMMVDAPNSGNVVRTTGVNWNNVVGVGRPG